MSLAYTNDRGQKCIRSDEALELDVARLSYECIERCREMGRVADGLGDGRLRLLIQTLHAAAEDVNQHVYPEEER